MDLKPLREGHYADCPACGHPIFEPFRPSGDPFSICMLHRARKHKCRIMLTIYPEGLYRARALRDDESFAEALGIRSAA